MANILEQIKALCDHNKVSITALEAQIGASKGVISRALANGTDIQSKWLVKIVENYPRINAHWLLTGEGGMFIEEPQAQQRTAAPAAGGMSAELLEIMHKWHETQKMLHETQRMLHERQAHGNSSATGGTARSA